MATVRRSLRASTATTCSRTASVTGRATARAASTTAATVQRRRPPVTRFTTPTAVTITTTDIAIAAVTQPRVGGMVRTAKMKRISTDKPVAVVQELPTERSSLLFSFHPKNSARLARIITTVASDGKRNITVWRPSICPSVCLSHRHIYHDSPGGSMRSGQHTFWPDKGGLTYLLSGRMACIRSIDTAYCYMSHVAWSLCLCLCVGHTGDGVSCSKTAEPIEMSFGWLIRVYQRNHALHWG